MSLTMTLPIHIPALLQETIEGLNVQPGRHYIDCTLGTGGHATAILERSTPNGRLLGIDTDPEAIEISMARLSSFGDRAILVNDNFTNLETICHQHGFIPANGILLDLGISSPQLDTAERGFSFQQNATLDMRFNPEQELTAADIVNILPEDQLRHLIQNYGEEHYSRQIASYIVRSRPLKTTLELARLIEQVVGRRGRIHPATRTFMALRIAVNRELENLDSAMKQAINCLKPQGRLAVISYHSLEDRIVKEFIKRESTQCLCHPKTPTCHCGHMATLKPISKKVIRPSQIEIESNPRSRSAKLRIAEHL